MNFIFFLLYASCFSLLMHANHTPEIIVEMDFFVKDSDSKVSGMRTVPSYPCPRFSYVDYSHLSITDFKQIFSQQISDHAILSNYQLYAFPQFVTYARTLSSYNDFMLSLHTKITNDKMFRKSTSFIPGFEHSFGLFHDFVRNEALSIQGMQQRFASKVKECKKLITVFTAKKELCFDNAMRERLMQRINALEQTCQQQNILHSPIDNQLHKELSDVSYVINRLERALPNNHYVQTIAPVIKRYVEQAKTVQSLAKAFELSDFCYTVTQVLTHGIGVFYDASIAIGRGAHKSAQTFVTPEHWRDMATGVVELGMLCIATLGEQEGLRYKMMLASMSQDPCAQERVAQHYCEYTQAQKDAVSTCAQQTYHKIKAMPWQEVVEGGAEIGTSMILDTLALHALSGFTRAASGSLVKQLNSALESGAIFTEQYAVEVADFGKLIVQEGPETAFKAIDIIKNEPALFAKKTEGIAETIGANLSRSQWRERIVQKIRNVGDDILDVMEKAGGHTLEKHVAQTHKDLIFRAIKGKPPTVTTFSNKRTAINAVKENLKNNAEEIVSWLATNPPSNSNKVFDCLHSYPIGEGILKDKKNSLYSLAESRIVLAPNPTNEFGFEIVTSFPILKK